jgi:hypothetical protein
MIRSGAVRSGAVKSGAVKTGDVSSSGSSAHDGISFNASSGLVTIKAPGAAPVTSALTSAFTFTGGNQSMYLGAGGLLVASATNTPRIEYAAGGAILGLLMEASRTNLCLQSADFGTTWATSLATISTNQTAAPDGTTTADKLVSSSGTSAMFVGQAFTLSATTAYTLSVFAKRIAGEVQYVSFRPDVDTAAIVSFDLTNGTVNTTQAPWTNSKITDYGNGWYRISATYTTVGTAYTFRIGLDNTGNAGSYTGDGTKGVFLWGGQLEQAAFASSYIPTTTVSVARTADSCIRTLASEFSATAGTVVVAGRASGGQSTSQQVMWSFDDGLGANNRIQHTRTASADISRFIVSSAGVIQAALDGTFVNSTAFKQSSAWTLNDFASSFNGAAVNTDAAGTLPTVTLLGLGVIGDTTGQANGHIRTFDYWPVRYDNATLQFRST